MPVPNCEPDIHEVIWTHAKCGTAVISAPPNGHDSRCPATPIICPEPPNALEVGIYSVTVEKVGLRLIPSIDADLNPKRLRRKLLHIMFVVDGYRTVHDHIALPSLEQDLNDREWLVNRFWRRMAFLQVPYGDINISHLIGRECRLDIHQRVYDSPHDTTQQVKNTIKDYLRKED